MTDERFQYIKGLFDFERLSRDEEGELIAEVERLGKRNNELLYLLWLTQKFLILNKVEED